MGLFSFLKRVCRREADTEHRRIINREGGVFCGLCDMRIATVLLNSVHIVIASLLMILAIFNGSSFTNFAQPLVAITLSSLSICAAMNFLALICCICTFGLFALFLWYAFTFHMVSLVLAGVILFAQSCLLHEMITGIMTKKNYVNEEFITDEGRQALEAAHGIGTNLAVSTRCMGKEISDETQEVAGQVAKETTEMVKTSTRYLAPVLGFNIEQNDCDESESSFSPTAVEC